MKKLLAALLVLLLLAVGAAGAFVLYRKHQSRNVRGSSSVEFVTTTPKPVPEPANVPWPTYGYDDARLRLAPFDLRPPYRRIWTWHGRALLEFPPAIANGRLYLSTFDGRFFALDAATGKAVWRFYTHRCGWASPAISGKLVLETFIGHPPCDADDPGSDGELIAWNALTGHIVWRRKLGPTESSPLVANGRAYVGDWRGNVYAIDVRTGRIRWSYHTGGRVKGSAALDGNRLYIGSYDGHVYALNARTGHRYWRASSQPRLGSRGTFYATPAAAYGRVYIGSTDGKVYSFGATSGKLRWSHGTGSYVYSSAAIWKKRVLVGSYDGGFYSLDAATGDVRWRFQANGPISGSPTILAGVVYFSTFKRRTYALAAATGKLLWSYPDGKYSPVVSDGKRVYLVGYGKLYGMVPAGG